MCCEGPGSTVVPPVVATMLAAFRERCASGVWGDGGVGVMARINRHAPFLPPERCLPLVASCLLAAGGDMTPQRLDEAVFEAEGFGDLLRSSLPHDRAVPGLVVVGVGERAVRVQAPPPRWVLPGRRVRVDLLVESELEREATMAVGGRTFPVPAMRATLVHVELGGDPPPPEVTIDGRFCPVRLVQGAPAAVLHLEASRCTRWSVTDSSGDGWFPDGVLRKWDSFGRPYFHGATFRFEVPAGVPLEVRAARGLEFRPARTVVALEPAEVKTVELEPERLFDPNGQGWFGADLHVHMNYGGTTVCEPRDAMAMQRGEGLNLMNLVAANCATALVYDRELLEAMPGVDLPGSTEHHLTRAGVEYRNDLLGHFHATSPAGPPTRYASGHPFSDAPEDWPPNATACRELRRAGATIGYCHPIMGSAIDEDSPPDAVLAGLRTMEAREAVADAALGLVDSIDVVSNGDFLGSSVLYRRLLGAGIPLAVTAGTDSLLSFSRFGTYSNPPGWARVYARLGTAFDVDAFREAVRAGRTMATNGPWLELEVQGQGPGARIDCRPGARLLVEARLRGALDATLRVCTAEGVLAETTCHEAGVLSVELAVTEATFVTAMAVGPPNDAGLDFRGQYAHTSAVYVDVDGRGVRRPQDLAWCLRWLDLLEALVRREGTFSSPAHLEDLVEVIEEARTVYATAVT